MGASIMALSAMKAAVMKGTKSMKAKRVSKITRGKLARAQVMRGNREKTVAGLTKDKLMRNKFGKIVSKAVSAARKKQFQSSSIKVWAECIKAARKELNLKGFVAINGKQSEGKVCYAKIQSFYAE